MNLDTQTDISDNHYMDVSKYLKNNHTFITHIYNIKIK